MTEHQSQYLLIFTGLVAVAVLIEAFALGALAIATAKLMKQIADLTGEAKGKVYPILDNVQKITDKSNNIVDMAHGVVADATPKLQRVVDNIAETSDVYRAKIAEIDTLISDTTDKARKQTERVDDMVGNIITKTGSVASHLQDAVMAPARHLAGIIQGAKGSIEHLVHSFSGQKKTPRPRAFEGDSVYTGLEDDYHA